VTDLPPNPYTATNNAVETRSNESVRLHDAVILDVAEEITLEPNGARTLTKTDHRRTSIDGRTITPQSILVICDDCREMIAADAARPCSVCKRIVCLRDMHHVTRNNKQLEVCRPCRWRTFITELFRAK